MLFLKTKKKYSQKFVSHIKIAWHSKRQKESIEKKEEKRKMRKSQTTVKKIFLLLLFYIEKYIFR